MKTKFEPYYAVIFTSTQGEQIEGYSEMAEKMELIAKEQDGFIGIDSARNDVGITVSYWQDLDSIKKWKQNSEHLIAQRKGRSQWYNWYNVRICKIKKEYEYSSP